LSDLEALTKKDLLALWKIRLVVESTIYAYAAALGALLQLLIIDYP